MEQIEQFCPAKVNLFLAVTGRRADGFHDLVSLMAPLDLGDRLRLSLQEGEGVSFHCSDPALPQGEDNLVLRALAAFRRRHSFPYGLRIELEKRVPAGAGLGGGSSDAAGLLLALNRLLGEPLRSEQLHKLAASVGSDCPFFLTRRAAVVRGRGERVELLPQEVCERFRGERIFLIKPSFGISTAWAYGALARTPEEYCPAERAEELVAEWLKGGKPLRELLFNNLEPPVFRKFVPLPVLKKRFQERLGLPVLMSGSGSTLFALIGRGVIGQDPMLRGGGQRAAAEAQARDALGDGGWLAEVRLL